MENNILEPNDNLAKEDFFEDIKYILKSSSLITEHLKKGCDVTQMPNGDIFVTEVKFVNTRYTWDPNKYKMIRVNNIDNKG